MLRLLQVDLSPATATVTVATVEPQNTCRLCSGATACSQTMSNCHDLFRCRCAVTEAPPVYCRVRSQRIPTERRLARVGRCEKAAEETLREELEKARQLAWEQDNEVLTLRESTRRLHTELQSAQSRDGSAE